MRLARSQILGSSTDVSDRLAGSGRRGVASASPACARQRAASTRRVLGTAAWARNASTGRAKAGAGCRRPGSWRWWPENGAHLT